MVYDQSKDNSTITYNQVIEYNKEWVNVLIKPSDNDDNKFSLFELHDGMNLYSLKINTSKYIKYYVDNTHSGSLVYELANTLKIQRLIDKYSKDNIL